MSEARNTERPACAVPQQANNYLIFQPLWSDLASAPSVSQQLKGAACLNIPEGLMELMQNNDSRFSTSENLLLLNGKRRALPLPTLNSIKAQIANASL